MKTDQERLKELGKQLTEALMDNINGKNDDLIIEISNKIEKIRGFSLPKPRKKEKK